MPASSQNFSALVYMCLLLFYGQNEICRIFVNIYIVFEFRNLNVTSYAPQGWTWK